MHFTPPTLFALLIAACGGCATQEAQWTNTPGIITPCIPAIEGTYENRRIGNMRPDKGLWFLLTGEDKEVESGVTIKIGSNSKTLNVQASADGSILRRELRFKNMGSYLALETRHDIDVMSVPMFLMHGADRIKIASTESHLVLQLNTSGTIYLGIVPTISAGGSFQDLTFPRQL